MADIRQGSVLANGLRFAYLEAGSGPLALCLHGFPDSAWTYRHLLPRLAGAGYHAVAPFMRGYAPTALPEDENFSTQGLADDTAALHDALGGDRRAVLIAHDWGPKTPKPHFLNIDHLTLKLTFNKQFNE